MAEAGKPGVCRYCDTAWRHRAGHQATPGTGIVECFDWMTAREVGRSGLG